MRQLVTLSMFTGLLLLGPTAQAQLGSSFADPLGGWRYAYLGNDAAGLPQPGGVALDGTWRSDNGSDEWDGLSRLLNGADLGGVDASGGILTIEDATTTTSGTGNNRKLYFTHDPVQDGLDLTTAGALLDSGLTLFFRARLTPQSGVVDLTSAPNGYGIFSGGKGNFGYRQSSDQIISFSLVNQIEDISPTSTFTNPAAGLTMNRNVGDAPTSGVNSDSTIGGVLSPNLNLVPVDPSLFHEFWITIQANDATPGNGTHTVKVYVDGTLTPSIFDVTAGNGDEGTSFPNYLELGANNSSTVGAFDVDFFAYKEGVLTPSLIPEPTIGALLGLGLAGLFLRPRRRA